MIATCALPPSAKNLVVTTPHHPVFTFYRRYISPTTPDDRQYLLVVALRRTFLPILIKFSAPFVKSLPTYVKDTNHALHIFDSFRFDTATPGHHFLFTMDVKSLYTVIPNDCGLQALSYILDKRNIKEPSTSTLTRLAELVLSLDSFSLNNEYHRQLGGLKMGSRMGPTMPAYSSDMWYNKSENSTQDSCHSCTRGTSTTLLGQPHSGGRN